MFNEEGVEYLIVGAHAVIHYAEPRYTKDIDIWVNPEAVNAARVLRALRRFGAPLSQMTAQDFTDPELVYQMGVPPNRIDILMGIDGVSFREAWLGKVETTYDGEPMHVIGKKELIKSKRATGRPQDLLDVERLEGWAAGGA